MDTSSKKVDKTNDDELMEEFKMLDNDTVLSILSIGDSRMSHLKLQKMVFLLARVGKLISKATPYKFGAFDEYLMEKLQSKGQDLISRQGAKYLLTEKGKEIYLITRDKVREKKPVVVEFSDVIRKMNENELLAVTYFLFPEYASNSEIYRSVSADIEIIKKRKSNFVVSDKDGEVLLELKE